MAAMMNLALIALETGAGVALWWSFERMPVSGTFHIGFNSRTPFFIHGLWWHPNPK